MDLFIAVLPYPIFLRLDRRKRRRRRVYRWEKKKKKPLTGEVIGGLSHVRGLWKKKKGDGLLLLSFLKLPPTMCTHEKKKRKPHVEVAVGGK